MAHWTPYTQEVAVDLSKHAVKVEKVSPLAACTAPEVPPQMEPFRLYSESQYYSTYPYQYAVPVSYAVPSSVSPGSVGSSWSRCGQTAPSPQGSPHFYDSESLSEDVEYQVFERDALRVMAEKNGGSLLGNNPRMRRAVQSSQTADGSYRKQRERNNVAAKQSRDRRKLREIRLALQVTYLEKKKAELEAKLAASVCGRCGQIRKR